MMLWYGLGTWKIWISGVVLLGLLIMGVGCSFSIPTPVPTVIVEAKPPEIISFTHLNPVIFGNRISIQVNVKTNGHTINYRWIVKTGEGEIINGDGTSLVTYQAPDTPGSFKVGVRLEYKDGLPVEGSTEVEVIKPTPAPSYTPKPTPIETPSHTPTPKPIKTSSPIATFTSPPPQVPTDTSPPIPEAVVIAPNGLNLRSGPGTNYDPPIGFLKNGEVLKILGRIADNKWIKVLVVNQGIEGWVSANPNYVQVNNVDWAEILLAEVPSTPTSTAPTATPTPRLTYGPHLLEPPRWASYPKDATVRFTWEPLNLKEDEFYSIIILQDGLSPEKSCIHTQTKDPEIFLRLNTDYYQCPIGDYHWSVSVATKLKLEGDKFDWRDESWEDEKNPLGIGQPHSKTPKEKENGSTGKLPTPPP